MLNVYKFLRNKKMKLGALISFSCAILMIVNVKLPENIAEIGFVSGGFIFAFGFIDKIERFFKWQRVDKK